MFVPGIPQMRVGVEILEMRIASPECRSDPGSYFDPALPLPLTHL
jgi:hypothetical protein